MNIKLNLLDKAINSLAPTTGAKRVQSKMQIGAAMSAFNTGGGFDTAGNSKKFLRHAKSSPNSHNNDYISKRINMIGLSRDSAMNTPLAKTALTRKTTNIVGSGLRINITPDHETLHITKDQSAEWAANTEKLFNNCALNHDFDITRKNNFYEMQNLVQYSIFLSGDCFIAFPYKKLKTLSVGTRVKIIESDLVNTPPNLMANPNVIAGVETDTHGAPVNYYFCSNYTTGNFHSYAMPQYTSIKAFDSKTDERNILHLYYKVRPNQTRGVMLLAECINLLKQVTKLAESELTAHVISSFFTVFVRDTDGFNEGILEDQAAKDVDPNADPTAYTLSSGNIVELDDNKTVEIAQPRQAQEGFEPFYNMFVKQLAACIDMSSSELLISFNASYSAARGELLEAFKSIRKNRFWLANNFCQPVYNKWLDEMIATKQINATGYFEDLKTRNAWRAATWSGVGMGQIDPLKETKAAIMKIDATLSNESIEYNAMNDTGDYTSNIKTLAFNKKQRLSMGLVMNTSTDVTPDNLESEEDDEEAKNE